MTLKTTGLENALAVSICLAVGLTALDLSVINTVLPHLALIWQVSYEDAGWASCAYTIALTSTLWLSGWFCERFGQAPTFRTGLVIFASSSALAGLSPSLAFFIVGRGIQGFGAAMLQVSALTLLATDISAADRPRAMGRFGIAIGIGPLIGPLFGGAVVSLLSWRWLFWINAPLTLASFVIGRRALYSRSRPTTPTRSPLFAGALGISIIAFSLALSASRLLDTFARFALGCGGCANLFWLLSDRVYRRTFLPRSLSSQPDFWVLLLASSSFGFCTASILAITPYYLAHKCHIDSWRMGTLLALMPLGVVLTSTQIGRLTRRFTIQKTCDAGLCLLWVATLILCLLHGPSMLAQVAAALSIYGLGAGLFQTCNTLMLVNMAREEDKAKAAALNRLSQSFGISAGGSFSFLAFQYGTACNLEWHWLHRLGWLAGIVLLSLVLGLKTANINRRTAFDGVP